MARKPAPKKKAAKMSAAKKAPKKTKVKKVAAKKAPARKAAAKKTPAKKAVAKKAVAKKAPAKKVVAKKVAVKKAPVKKAPVKAKAAPAATKAVASVTIATGMDAPDFNLPTDGGGTLSLAELKGRPVVLYFYPRDDTPGCTVEACEFRDNLPHFGGINAAVLGVSIDSAKSHDKFKAKYSLPFPLLADEEHSLAEKYGVWVEKNRYGRTYMGTERSTFLIDAMGKVAKVWRKVKVEGHAAEVLEATKGL
ncbi:MAG TPA: thioredoxin-dependent thiol peroxidase [Magnetospirillaceae bacterium]|jgi:peroxiredoxin Q/BCP